MAVERMAPDSLTLTNLTGSLTDIDEDPDTGDLNWLVATGNNVATTAAVTFPTPANPLTDGANQQEFRAQVRKFSLTQSGTPTVVLDLYDNGTLISSSSAVSVTSAVGQVVAYTWDATGRTAATVECRVRGIATGGGPSVRNTVDVGAVEWNATTTATFTATAASVLPGLSQAVSGSFTADTVYSGTASSVLPALSQSASGSSAPPTWTGTAASVLPGLSQSASGSSTAPVFTGSATSTLPALAQAATGTSTPPTWTGSAASVLPSLSQTATGSASPPTFTGTATSALPLLSQSASGSFTGSEPGTYTATAASVLPVLSQSAGGSHTAPVFTGSATSVLPVLIQAAVAAYSTAVVFVPAQLTASSSGPTLTATASGLTLTTAAGPGASLTSE